MAFKKLLTSYWPLFLIIIFAAIFRFWRLEALTTFGGDQGYDFLIVKRILIDGHFTLLGPKIGPYNNLGNLYLGPFYYYLIAPSLLIFNLDPLGPAVFSVILSLLTIVSIYLISLKFLSKQVAILASSFYSFDVFLINQSRAVSNPHFIPFFSSVLIFSVFQTILKKSKSTIWPILAGLSLGFIFQLHYLGASLFLSVLIILAILKEFRKILILFLSFAVAISPQIIFELRHKFFVTSLILKQVRNGNLVSSGSFFSHFQKILENLYQIFGLNNNYLFLPIIFLLILIPFFALKKDKILVYIFLLSTIFFNLLLLFFYPGEVNAHYFAPIYVSLTLFAAISFVYLFNFSSNLFLKSLLILILIQFFAFNFLNLDLSANHGYTMPEGWNLEGIRKASKIIARDPDSTKKFNVAATLDGDTRARPYRYFLELAHKIPQGVEDYPNSQVLYLISRDEENRIRSYTVWEISSFAPFNITKLTDIQNGIKVYKLTKK